MKISFALSLFYKTGVHRIYPVLALAKYKFYTFFIYIFPAMPVISQAVFLFLKIIILILIQYLFRIVYFILNNGEI